MSVVVIWSHGSALSVDDLFVEVGQISLDRCQRVFHLDDGFVQDLDDLVTLLDELIDSWRFPFVFIDTWVDLNFHILNLLLHEWLFHRV